MKMEYLCRFPEMKLCNIEDILDKLRRGRYFTALNYADAYLQVLLASED
jgi:hypothetical protein